MSTDVFNHRAERCRDIAQGVLMLAALAAVRLGAWIVYLLLSLAEPFVTVVLCGLALGSFFVSVVFGFILGVPFPHRWFVLGASVVFLGLYLLFGLALRGVARLLR